MLECWRLIALVLYLVLAPGLPKTAKTAKTAAKCLFFNQIPIFLKLLPVERFTRSSRTRNACTVARLRCKRRTNFVSVTAQSTRVRRSRKGQRGRRLCTDAGGVEIRPQSNPKAAVTEELARFLDCKGGTGRLCREEVAA
jgi:hypothetical protein